MMVVAIDFRVNLVSETIIAHFVKDFSFEFKRWINDCDVYEFLNSNILAIGRSYRDEDRCG